MRYLVIEPHGKVTLHDGPWGLKVIQELVGGYIEAVVMRYEPEDGPSSTALRGCTGYVNEEGKLSDPPLLYNALASAFAYIRPLPFDYIAGNMVVVGPADRKGDDTPLPTEALERLIEAGVHVDRISEQ